MERLYGIREKCSYQPCQNDARYTTGGGKRMCALCATGVVAVRDSDLPAFISQVFNLLDELDHKGVEAGAFIRGELRSHIGIPKRPEVTL